MPSETVTEEVEWPHYKIASFPFVSAAKRYIEEQGIGIKELLEGMHFASARQRGMERVKEALENKKILARASSEDSTEMESFIEILSYPVARMLVSVFDENFLTSRYALGEAENLKDMLGYEDAAMIIAIADELGIKVDLHKEDDRGILWRVHFLDYLKDIGHLTSPSWKLVNQEIRNGKVLLEKNKVIRMLKEKLFNRISEELPLPVTPEIGKALGSHVEKIREILEIEKERIESFDEREFGAIETELFPPCIKKLIKDQQSGVNLTHEARFAITSFLHAAGMNKDGILAFFSKSPDFDVDLARYQIEHILGEISGQEYSPPGCGHMKTHRICFKPDSLCEMEWMEHPIIYYSVKKKDQNTDNES